MSRSSTSLTDFRAALQRCRGAFIGAGLFSGMVNVLALTGSLYMLQLYDRVIPAHSLSTLVALTVIMLVLYLGHGFLDIARSRIMTGIGLRIERSLRGKVFAAVLQLPLRVRQKGDGLRPVRDLDQIRSFLSSSGPTALFDLPWLPIYLGLVFVLHPWLGLLGTAGAALLLVLTILTEAQSRKLNLAATESAAHRQAFVEAQHRGAEAIHALGMSGRANAIWRGLSEKHLLKQAQAADIITFYGTLSKMLRMLLQSAVLGLGAFLVIQGEATGGVMIAASIMVSRALAPIEIAIANWRGFVAARQGAARLATVLGAIPTGETLTGLPKPSASLVVEDIWVAPPGHTKPVIRQVSFTLERGDTLAVIGPSASGKSTLARALVGAWGPQRGTIRLDGATLAQWLPDEVGKHIGYLPQEIDLFEGTVAANIARLEPDASSNAIIAAAKLAGVHDMVLHLPDGYDTQIGDRGSALSAGQRQRIALARALYGDPFLLVLDEPNSNLDADGDVALTQAIAAARERGAIVIVVAHRPSALAGIDRVMVVANGAVQAFGPKDEVLRQTTRQPAPSSATAHSRLKVISDVSSGE